MHIHQIVFIKNLQCIVRIKITLDYAVTTLDLFSFGYTKCGEFIFDLSGICLSIKENKTGEFFLQ